ncbi:hypothetical protein RhiirC2_773058 [Rhizophagus irregularis]|uniref:Uncharacterized protein n=1 Tax=Rhizophagus irregularis TaxID=588596 RepID=A0A2N1NPW5_9GLOM|nr:hypothetical protein RhiirC2_773058 [Rhizophagus irregularis]
MEHCGFLTSKTLFALKQRLPKITSHHTLGDQLHLPSKSSRSLSSKSSSSFSSCVYKKTLDVPSQYRIAREIRDISLDDIGFNQSMVSRMYNNIDIPKCDKTLTAIKNWINKELERKEKHENLD